MKLKADKNIGIITGREIIETNWTRPEIAAPKLQFLG
jgi:hypothetical protein